ncbi:hypothetical protein G6F64_011519 [Rhizopus arrhizus]|uniref:CCHC-type domain-containing protein n=1 Tax=Rhizopus oryzae TaxID=64495 RepID=A0A9P6WZJ2_RHIOR|nr:hypothetical protein G6F32_011347 [Rhizopus arrhizus]KAG1301758.1 hypothetical protein G6F64_011519 [Rhizopus arrhizus]
MGRQIEAQIVRNDQNLERFRRYIVGELHTLISEYGSRFARFVRSVQWSTVEACRDLNAPDHIVHYVQTHLTMAWDPMETTSSGENADSSMIEDMKQMIRELQAQLLVERGRQAPADKSCDLSAVGRPDPGRTADVALEASELSSEEIKERRRRVHIPTFSNGSIQEAKDWLAEYKSICYHLRFTEREQLDDLQVRFKGTALSWYTYLLPTTKSRWSSLEQSFVEYFAGGENTVEAALNELRQLKQGPTRMVVFGQQLREVARRAGIHSDKMLIGYLKTAVNPEMTKAIIYRGPSTYGQAVNICIEVETDLLHLADTKVSYTPGYVNLNVRHTEREEKTTEIQNYQEKYNRGKLRDMRNIRCYKCQKMGHMKRDCRVKTTDRKGYYDKQNQQDLESDNREVKAEEIYKEPDTNIFSQFFQSNNNAEIDEKRTTDVNRFKLTVSTGHGDESVLILGLLLALSRRRLLLAWV